MWKNPLQTFVVGLIMTTAMSLSACDSDKQNTVEEVASTISAEKPAIEVDTSESAKADSDLDDATTEQGVPVKYDVSSWSSGKVESVSIDKLDKIKPTFGKVVTTDENSLDYASNPATKYRFMATDEPYLDLIDSEKYLELGWYYANPTDSDAEKELSQKHAKKSYKLARQLMGDDGGKILSDMLSGQIIKNKTAGGQKIELAKCEFYSCMLILNKSAATTDAS